ncbi:hypothetical protein GCM10010869_34130 [Mesorhizobium tianshanense]|uniref:Uncharacterized protein n=1 Tax=Mesorhizobium tianshanense TaxID=39844 RepID=A0A562MSM2_9HYPH|nr:hypothetical protein IQ26_06602 [Mesorhizobium tianshanense]GLS37819.1 hypothetical protein GCM10010869_34130 [Mesorhizobium tianshanense]
MIDRQTTALDALDSVLPFDRRDFLAGLLTDDVATLRHLAREGIRSPAVSAQNDPSVAVNGHRHRKVALPISATRNLLSRAWRCKDRGVLWRERSTYRAP